jgi:peptidyl-prolyl cis-trans isomerase D
MLQAMRDRVMGVLGWIVIGLIIITFALFGLGSYLQDHTRLYAARVNGVDITPHELQLAYQNQRASMEQMLGDAFRPEMIDEKRLKQQALENLIRRQLILQEAESQHMAISDQLLAARIHAFTAFHKDGRFDADLYQDLLSRQGQTPAGFEQEMRLTLVGQQLTNGISSTGFVTDSELGRIYSLQQQKRSFEFITVAAAPLQAAIEPDQADIQAYYQAHSDTFMTPQRVRLDYVRLNAETLGKDIEIDDQAIQASYEQKKAALKTQEQRRASHILFPLAADADEATVEQTRAKAAGVLQEIRDGADFASLAEQYSGDPGSAKQGGDLGYFSAGDMVPEFDTAVFAMQPGDVSDLVRSQFGFHIIKLVDIKRGEVPPLEKVRDELVKDLRQRQVDEQYYEQIEQLTDTAYEHPDSLQAAADALGLPIETSDWITAATGAGIGQYAKVRAAAFTEDVLESGNNSEPIELGQSDAVVVRVKDREAAHPTPLEDVRDRIVEELKQQGAAQAARERGEALLAQLAAGKSPGELADAEGLELQKADAVARNAQGYNPQLLKTVFQLPRPTEGATVDKGIALPNGDYVVARLVTVTDADPSAMSEAERSQLKQGLENMRRNLALTDMVAELRRHAEVEIPPQDNDTP